MSGTSSGSGTSKRVPEGALMAIIVCPCILGRSLRSSYVTKASLNWLLGGNRGEGEGVEARERGRGAREQ